MVNISSSAPDSCEKAQTWKSCGPGVAISSSSDSVFMSTQAIMLITLRSVSGFPILSQGHLPKLVVAFFGSCSASWHGNLVEQICKSAQKTKPFAAQETCCVHFGTFVLISGLADGCGWLLDDCWAKVSCFSVLGDVNFFIVVAMIGKLRNMIDLLFVGMGNKIHATQPDWRFMWISIPPTWCKVLFGYWEYFGRIDLANISIQPS